MIRLLMLALALPALTPKLRGQTASVFSTLYSFSSNGADGHDPFAALVEGSDGNFYGTTSVSGCFDFGTVFSITPSGVLTTLHCFTNNPDGTNPHASLVKGSDGNFYGTTGFGGSNNKGTVFSITPAGVLTTLHNFNGLDGGAPHGALVQGNDGNFYGTTLIYGGSNGDDGTVFSITPAGVFTTMHIFTGSDGFRPQAALVQGSDGNFYGTTELGGDSNFGTVFSITPAGVLTTLHSFNGTDGANPFGALLEGSKGIFYGTTAIGGNSNDGTVFSITSAGVFTTVHTFIGNGTEGSNPYAGLIRGSDGLYYGTTEAGGSSGTGTVYSMTPAGVVTVLHSFTESGTDGATPQTQLVQASDGNLYGTTNQGGSFAGGTVFKLSGIPLPGAVHFVSTIANISEDADSVTLAVQRNGGSAGAASVQYSETDGTGSAGLDYKRLEGTLTWAGGDASAKSITIPILDRSLYDGSTKTFTVNLANATGANLGSPATAAVNILDNDKAPVGKLAFAVSTTDINKSAGQVTLTVNRTSGSAGGATVGYATANGTAVNGTDYSTASGTLTWAAGDATAKAVTVPILDRGIYDGSTKTFTVKLANATDASLGTPATATVNVLDNDTAPQPGVNLASPSDGTTLTAGAALTLTANVTDPAGILASVQFLIDGTVVGTVPAGTSYVFTATVPGSPGIHSVQAVAVDTLGRTSASATLSVQVVAAMANVVTVGAAGDGTAVAGGQKGKVFFVRTGDTTQPLTVYYKAKGSAVAGVDYQPLSGSVTILAGASKAKVKVKPLADSVPGTRKVKLRLLLPNDGSYTLDETTVAKIKVIDNG